MVSRGDNQRTGRRQSELDAALNEVAGHLNAQHACLVDLTLELLADESGWCGPGVHTPELFLAWRVGLSPQRARQIVAIARRAHELPECLGAFRRGELAVDQMAAIAQRAPWWTDREILGLGRNLTVRQLRNTLARYPFPEVPTPDAESSIGPDAASPAADPDATEGEAAENHAGGGDASEGASDPTARPDAAPGEPSPIDRFWCGLGDDGRFRLTLETDSLTGMIMEAALREARDSLFQGGQHDVDSIDALREVAQRSLGSVDEPSRRDRFRISIHLDTDGEAHDAHGWTLPDAIRRHITCDGLLSPTFVRQGIPISVGRTQRAIPERTRRLVLLRDQGCTVPGCQQTHFIEVHHIVHWEDDGPTDTWNLLSLCPHHHRLHHRGELEITGNADQPGGVRFANRHGLPIGSSGAKPTPPGAPPPTPAGVYRHPIGERVDPRWVQFTPPPERQSA
ncbi:MAG: DUF222 domain-containing protein [Ilumatobacteraceae bacterium]